MPGFLVEFKYVPALWYTISKKQGFGKLLTSKGERRIKLMNDKLLKINVAAICPATRVLGPGKRFAIWVQGCCFACDNCCAPAWRAMKVATLLTPAALARRVLQTPGIEGLTISGGEPMLQAEGLAKLVQNIHSVRPLPIICYTGFTLEELKTKKDAAVAAFLAKIDVLVAGTYIDRLNDNKGLRGSTNQEIRFLSGVYQEFAVDFVNYPRDMEVHLFQDEYLLVGIKPKKRAKLSI
ncbi:radical SAM protein [Thermodesulfovibrionales bacterium]|nr:radical SAM protein [Thermodesulfovibrionales bacterium]